MGGHICTIFLIVPFPEDADHRFFCTKELSTYYFIAITAYALSKDKTKALVAGCDSIISKPVDKDILFEELAKFLKKK